MSEEMQRIVLAKRPEGRPGPENFRLERVAMPQPGDGEVLLRVLWMSLDPYMRGRMDDAKSYATPVGVGEQMGGARIIGHEGETLAVHLGGLRVVPCRVEGHTQIVELLKAHGAKE